jgi:amino acid permease
MAVQLETQFQQGALHFKQLTFAQAVMIMVGGNVGAAILSLPYAARASGYFGAVLISLVTTAFSIVSHLYIVEIMLRTKSPGQLVGLMRTYVFDGRFGRLYVALVSVLTVGLAIPSLTAYVMGGGQIIASLLHMPTWLGGLVFLAPGMAVVWVGLRAIGAAQGASSLLMGGILLTFTLVSATHPQFEASRLARFSAAPMLAALPIGVFTSMSQSIVPEVVRGLAHDPESIARAIKWGLGINLLFLLIFPLAIFGLQNPDAISQVVTISWGRALGPAIYLTVNLFALLALLTSFWASAGAIMGNVVEIMRADSEWNTRTRLAAFGITVAPSLALVLLGGFEFGDMIQAAGAVGGVILAVLPIFVLARARAASGRRPEYQVGVLYSPVVRIALLVFYLGVFIVAAFTR